MSRLDTDTSSSITAAIGYIADLALYETDMPYYLLDVESTPEVPSTNIEIIKRDVFLKDLRVHSDRIGIEASGFQIFDWPYLKIHIGSAFDDVEKYCNDMSKMLAKELAAEDVFVFDFRFRSNNPSSESSQSEAADGSTQAFFASPIHKAHLDQTQEGGLRRLRLHLTEEEFSKYISEGYRVRIINVWRSFNDRAQDTPLAFCNPSSIGKDDPLVIEIVEANRLGQNYYLRYNKDHEWFWASDMIPSEVMVFTTWDSKKTKAPTNCTVELFYSAYLTSLTYEGAYHTAFTNPAKATAPRMSLEIRTIVVNANV